MGLAANFLYKCNMLKAQKRPQLGSVRGGHLDIDLDNFLFIYKSKHVDTHNYDSKIFTSRISFSSSFWPNMERILPTSVLLTRYI
jgi:hypothetical protein